MDHVALDEQADAFPSLDFPQYCLTPIVPPSGGDDLGPFLGERQRRCFVNTELAPVTITTIPSKVLWSGSPGWDQGSISSIFTTGAMLVYFSISAWMRLP